MQREVSEWIMMRMNEDFVECNALIYFYKLQRFYQISFTFHTFSFFCNYSALSLKLLVVIYFDYSGWKKKFRLFIFYYLST